MGVDLFENDMNVRRYLPKQVIDLEPQINKLSFIIDFHQQISVIHYFGGVIFEIDFRELASGQNTQVDYPIDPRSSYAYRLQGRE